MQELMRQATVIGSLVTAMALAGGGAAVAAPVPSSGMSAVGASGDLTDCGLLLEGQRGACVEMLQEALNAEHPEYNLDPDGEFGASTRIALLDFQGRHRLPADGNAGPITLLELESLTSSVGTPSPGERVSITDAEICGAAGFVPDGAGGCTEPRPRGAVSLGKPVAECTFDQVKKVYKDIQKLRKAGKQVLKEGGKFALKRLTLPAQAAGCILFELPEDQ